MGGGPGGGGKEEVEPKEPGLNDWDGFVVKLEDDEEGLPPYLKLRSSGVDWLKFLSGGLLGLRPPGRDPGMWV